jgi:hypothetical protein
LQRSWYLPFILFFHAKQFIALAWFMEDSSGLDVGVWVWVDVGADVGGGVEVIEGADGGRVCVRP